MKKETFRKLAMACTLAALTLLLAACPPQKSIAELLRDPMRYHDQEVIVRGTVVQSIGALGGGMFEIDDGSGRLWVYSEGFGVPGKGIRVGVVGIITPTFTFAGRSFATVMRETQPPKGD
jgi:hypothetical protein